MPIPDRWYSCTATEWAGMKTARRKILSHVHRIESGDGEEVHELKCDRCRRMEFECWIYKPGHGSGENCSRCRYANRGCGTTLEEEREDTDEEAETGQEEGASAVEAPEDIAEPVTPALTRKSSRIVEKVKTASALKGSKRKAALAVTFGGLHEKDAAPSAKRRKRSASGQKPKVSH